MPLIVNSPYSGRPVKIRDQDIGRAIRDEEGRIFYAVPRSGGNGYYGAPTRHGSPRDEQRYLDMQSKAQQARETGAQASAEQVHDAMGRRRGGPRRLLLLVILLAVLAILGYVVWMVYGEEWLNRLPRELPTPQLPESPELPHELPLPDQAPQLPAPAPPSPQAAMMLPSAAAAGPGDQPPSALVSYAVNRNEAAASDAPPPEPVDPADAHAVDYITTASGLRYRILEQGRGRTAIAGAYVLIHYTARLSPGGPVMDTSHTTDAARAEADPPIGFVLWSGRVIRGWDEGISGMKIGEKRELIVPPDLITPPSTSPAADLAAADAPSSGLVFEIELIDVLPGVLHEVTRAGTIGGDIASPGDTVEVRYVGYVDGQPKPFDDSRTRPEPLRFRLGAGDVIRGWDLGIAGMTEGERRTLVIPPYLAYGQRGIAGLIPPGATLRYEIELLRVTP